ncbi:SRPBCC family protein [Methylobacillus gramineus]|uniref:SRPBCC family protein n=1 Tax=Methylobacillus gramineus TaxID=755169 RepID=UPI001CFF9C82|nr:SRPBCC family protein [Methylobacillus gramineus]MCB5185708.1 SRPBCC family protein [Methylobacillus gramineus]
MSVIEKSIQVNVPANIAYNQWTQFEDFPQFMEGITEVRQLDDTHLHWCANVAGQRKEWDAEITEQIPDKRIAWHSLSGTKNAGVITFHHIDDSTTRIMLQMDYDPEGVVENTGDALGILSHRVEGDLKRFKGFLESRGKETGAWRGKVEQGTSNTRNTRH